MFALTEKKPFQCLASARMILCLWIYRYVNLAEVLCNCKPIFLQMPKLDGTSAMKIIREEQPAPRGPAIVALTASAMSGDKEEALTNGFQVRILDLRRYSTLAHQLIGLYFKTGMHILPILASLTLTFGVDHHRLIYRVFGESV